MVSCKHIKLFPYIKDFLFVKFSYDSIVIQYFMLHIMLASTHKIFMQFQEKALNCPLYQGFSFVNAQKHLAKSSLMLQWLTNILCFIPCHHQLKKSFRGSHLLFKSLVGLVHVAKRAEKQPSM